MERTFRIFAIYCKCVFPSKLFSSIVLLDWTFGMYSKTWMSKIQTSLLGSVICMGFQPSSLAVAVSVFELLSKVVGYWMNIDLAVSILKHNFFHSLMFILFPSDSLVASQIQKLNSHYMTVNSWLSAALGFPYVI